MWRHYVYLHRKADTGEVFYVGKGTLRRSMAVYERAHSGCARNPWWHRTVAKHGITVEIAAHFQTDDAAQRFECDKIAEIGRERLVNLTDGGEGSAGRPVSDELRAKRSANASRPRSKAWIASIRRARKGGGNGGVVKHGDKLPQSWRDNIAAAKRGARRAET